MILFCQEKKDSICLGMQLFENSNEFKMTKGLGQSGKVKKFKFIQKLLFLIVDSVVLNNKMNYLKFFNCKNFTLFTLVL